jgi:sirohydrochlorin ferrochelatase
VSWDDSGDDLDIEEIVLERRGNRKPIASLDRATIKRALTGKLRGSGQLKVQGRSGRTFETLRVTGLEDGILRVVVRPHKLKGKGKTHAVTQVTQSRRRH